MWCAAQEFLNVILVRAAMTATSAGSQKKKTATVAVSAVSRVKYFLTAVI